MIATFPDGQLMQLLGFPAVDGFDLIQSLREHNPGFGFAIATNAGFAHEAGFSERMPAVVPSEPIDDVLTVGGDEIYKLFAFHPDYTVEELLDYLPALLPDSISAGHMGADAVDIGPESIDKCAGLRWLCERLDVASAEVIAIGDEGNDMTMLQWAGRGIAMANAPDHVKAIADEIAPSNNDGVAQVLEQLLAR